MSNHPRKHPILLGSLLTSIVVFAVSLYLFLRLPTFECLDNLVEVKNHINLADRRSTYSGSDIWKPIAYHIDPVIQQIYPDFRLNYSQTSDSTTAVQQLLNNDVSFSILSRPLRDQEQQKAENQGAWLEQIPVAIDGFGIIVNHQLDSIAGLTVEQLREIYRGNIRNWQELNGPDLPIVPYSQKKQDTERVTLFLNQVVNKPQLESHVKLVNNNAAGIKQVANNPGAIYYGAASELIPDCRVKPLALGKQENSFIAPYKGDSVISAEQCQQQSKQNQLNWSVFRDQKYPLTRYISIVIKHHEGTDEQEQAGKGYSQLMLTEQGQFLIRKLGLIEICQNN